MVDACEIFFEQSLASFIHSFLFVCMFTNTVVGGRKPFDMARGVSISQGILAYFRASHDDQCCVLFYQPKTMLTMLTELKSAPGFSPPIPTF